MWWKDPAFDKIITDAHNNEWSFKVWFEVKDDNKTQRIFFWDSNKIITGMVEFKNDQSIHFKKIKDRLIKLANDESYRNRFRCSLKFPLEKYY